MPYKKGFLGTTRQILIFDSCLKRLCVKYGIELPGTDIEKDFEEAFGAQIKLAYGEDAYNDMEERAKEIADKFTGEQVDLQIENVVDQVYEKYFNQ